MLDFFYHFLSDHLRDKRQKRNRNGSGQRSKDLSWCFVASSNPADQVAVRTYSSLLEYAEKGTYWTPNGFYRSDRRTKETLRWLHCIFVDIDDPDLIYEDILNAITDAGLPAPTMINKTPHGHHVYWKIEPVRAVPAAIKLYESITRAVAQAIGGDPCAVGAERFVRVPKNVVYFVANEYTLKDFVDWRNEEFEPQPKRENNRLVLVRSKGMLNHPAVAKLLEGVHEGIRDNTCFTLALVYKAEGYPSEYATEKLLEWNKKNDPPLPERIIRAKVRSAYSGKYHGPSARVITELSGIKFSYKLVSTPKPESQRKYKSSKNIETALINFIRNKGGSVAISLSLLAKNLGTPLSTLKLVIKRLRLRKKIVVVVHGTGRSAVSVFYLIKHYIKAVIARARRGRFKFFQNKNVRKRKRYQILIRQNNIHSLGGWGGGRSLARPP